MDAWKHASERKLVELQRRRPRPPAVLQLAVDGDGGLGPAGSPPPDQIHLETTYTSGEVASWLDDQWWIEVLERWRDRAMAVHILPTPFALLHPVVLHQIEMLRRVVPGWRRIGHVYLDDLLTDDDIARAAGSAYDELRVLDAPRPGIAKPAAELRGVTFQALLGRIKRMQAALKVSKPLVVRLPPDTRRTESAGLGLAEEVFTST